MSEAVIHRVLAAVRFRDATTRRAITSALRLTADKRMEWRRNASGLHVLWRAEGLDGHTGHESGVTDEGFEALFREPPDAPPPGDLTFVVTVEDPSGALLSRTFELSLPREKTAPAGATPELLTPAEVLLYRSAASRLAGGSAAVYVFVHDGRGEAGGLPGALVTVSVGANEVGRGVTGPSGEALVETVRLPSFAVPNGGGAVPSPEIHATVRAAVIPSSLREEAGAWRLKEPSNPDSTAFTEAAARAGTAEVILSVGRPANVSLPISL